MIYLANGAANAELLRSMSFYLNHEDESIGLEGCHTGGDTCVYISWRDEDEFETEIKMINCLQVDSTLIFI
jgi:hypothetical protein